MSTSSSSSSPLLSHLFLSSPLVASGGGGELNRMMLGPSWSHCRLIWPTVTNHNTQHWHPLMLLLFQPSLALRGHRDKFISLSLTDRSHTDRRRRRRAEIFDSSVKKPNLTSLPPSFVSPPYLIRLILHFSYYSHSYLSSSSLSFPPIRPHYPTLLQWYGSCFYFRD